jgi:hypothetical protein
MRFSASTPPFRAARIVQPKGPLLIERFALSAGLGGIVPASMRDETAILDPKFYLNTHRVTNNLVIEARTVTSAIS